MSDDPVFDRLQALTKTGSRRHRRERRADLHAYVTQSLQIHVTHSKEFDTPRQLTLDLSVSVTGVCKND
jgi:hypothetical protein